MSDQKIKFQGSLNMAFDTLVNAAKEYKQLFDDSELRLRLDDVEDIDKKFHLMQSVLVDIKTTNDLFRKIAR